MINRLIIYLICNNIVTLDRLHNHDSRITHQNNYQLIKNVTIVLDCWNSSHNGLVVSSKRFIEALKHQGYDFNVMVTDAQGENLVRFPKLKLPLVYDLMEKMKTPVAKPQPVLLERALENSELLHVQYPFFLGRSAIKMAKKKGIPTVCSFHVQPENMLLNLGFRSKFIARLLYKWLHRLFYNQVDYVICPSQFAADLLLESGLTKPYKVISNGLPDHFLRHDEKPLAAKGQRLKILSVGRFAVEKRQSMIIEALAMSGYQDRVELVLVGTGPKEEMVRQKASMLSCPVTIGKVSDEQLMQHYQSADLFVHASEVELEGMSVMEAMAQRLPVLVSNSPNSAARYFIDNENALFEFDDVADLSKKLVFWLTSPSARQQASDENYQRSLDFLHSRSCEKLISVYQEVSDFKAVNTNPESLAQPKPEQQTDRHSSV